MRAASTHFGGISPLKKVMDDAALYQIKSGFHGPTDVSPIGLAAQTHLGLAIHNFGIQEYMEHSIRTNTVFEQSMTFADGYLHQEIRLVLASNSTRKPPGLSHTSRPTCHITVLVTAPFTTGNDVKIVVMGVSRCAARAPSMRYWPNVSVRGSATVTRCTRSTT